METDARASFPSLLKAQRLARGLSQEGLAERAGLSREAISLLERGMRLSPRRDTITLLAKTLQLSVDERARLLAAASEQHGRVAPATRLVAGSPASLPVRLVSFIGREQEIAGVRELLLVKRLVTLTGPGGIGKTSLALAVAAVQEQFVDGVSLVELAALTDEELVPPAVAAVLGVREQEGEPILTTLGLALGTTQRLLVLDNCEHLLTSCARVAEALLRACPRLRILATSREPLRVGAEVIWRVPALVLPDAENQPLAGLAKSEAVCLFVERAGAVRPGFALSAGNAAAVAEICRRLDGIPLAIELAAARVGALPVQQIAQHLNDRFRLLTTGSRTALPRHRTLRALIDWSYDLLSESEQILFRRIAVFAGGWTLEAAEAVCGDVNVDVLDQLIGLVDKSVVLVEDRGGEARYRLLETLRQYADERLAESGKVDDLRQAHAMFFLALAEQKTATDWFGHDRRYLDQLEVEHDNLRAALQWFAERGDAERGLRLSSALGIFWYIRGHFVEGQRWLDDQLGRSWGVSPVVRATALEMAGRLAFARMDLAVAATFTRESVVILRSLGERRRLADVLHLLGYIARYQGAYPEAFAALEESLQIHQEYGDQFFIAEGLYQLGALARQRSELAEARSLLDRALTIHRVLGDPRPIGMTLFQLGLVAEDEGDDARAQSLYEQSVGMLQQVKERRVLALVVDAFASLSVGRSQYRRAALLSGAATTVRQQIGSTVPPPLQRRVDRTLRLAREGLGDEAFARAWTDGQAMTLEQAIACALEEEDGGL